jgi:hypothetical protein
MIAKKFFSQVVLKKDETNHINAGFASGSPSALHVCVQATK